jgi:hypothetical protein
MNWFEVDKQGLGKLLERRGKAFAVCELIQNAWDTDARHIQVTLTPIEGVPAARIEVEDDDPNGFAHLSHAFTLFAESVKKGDATKRGRFNLGEKLVLALCTEASIASTKGTVIFDKNGRTQSRACRAKGSKFSGRIKMTHAECDEALAVIETLIPPPGVETIVNGEVLEPRMPKHTIEVVLPTEVADEEGVLRRSERKTMVRIFEPLHGETPSVYEMGVPVVETGDRWHVDVAQKVPLNFDRDNLPPSYLRRLRVVVLNAMADHLTKDDANATWVRDAGSDKDATDAAMTKVMDLRFGEKRVVFDPSDPEANALAVSRGYTVIHGGMLNGREWDNVKRAGAALPAGKVTPSPKPFHEGGKPLKVLAPEKWTPAIRRVVEFAREVAREVIGVYDLDVTIANDVGWGFGGCYGQGSLTINLGRVGHRWFNTWREGHHVEQFLIHEFGHAMCGNHLDERYHEALCALGAKLARLALEKPHLWKQEA